MSIGPPDPTGMDGPPPPAATAEHLGVIINYTDWHCGHIPCLMDMLQGVANRYGIEVCIVGIDGPSGLPVIRLEGEHEWIELALRDYLGTTVYDDLKASVPEGPLP